MTRRSAARPDVWGSISLLIGMIVLVIVAVSFGTSWGVVGFTIIAILGGIGRALQLRGYAIACTDAGGDEYIRCTLGFHSYSYVEGRCTRCDQTDVLPVHTEPDQS